MGWKFSTGNNLAERCVPYHKSIYLTSHSHRCYCRCDAESQGLLMKRLLIALLIITITLAARFVYVKLFVQNSFGPLSILLVSILGCLSLLLSITLLLYKTRARETIAKIWLFIISISVTYVIVDLVSSYFLIQRLSPLIIADQYRH